MGSFFWNLAKDLRGFGAEIFKINFNGGDCLYYPVAATLFRDHMQNWENFLEQYIKKNRIDIILMFGDCRFIHATACRLAKQYNIETGVFEEGYIRPDHVTFERLGVNAYSNIPREPAFYETYTPMLPVKQKQVDKKAFLATGWYAVCYYTAATSLKPFFRHYKHHRPLNMSEGLLWIRSFYRKQYYRLKERGWINKLTGQLQGKFYLVPLQVANDAQVRNHSHYSDIISFILSTVESFAAHAPSDTMLVIKHHPMDRAYNDYSRLIRSLAMQYGLHDRLCYLHDQHLPTLLDATCGVVVINSTVGLSALHHGTPTKVCGKAIYDINGLTYQGTLDNFWRDAQKSAVDASLYENFLNYIIHKTQLNGSFYRKLAESDMHCGMMWNNVISIPSTTQQKDVQEKVLKIAAQ